MRVAVLGAGLVGVSTAWWLAREGHEVVVIDRRAGPALETSRANGGHVAASSAAPWASPRTRRELRRWLGRRDAPLQLALRLSPHQWAWCLRFLRECRAARHAANLRALMNLARYSRATLREMRSTLAIDDGAHGGILRLYRDAQALAQAQEEAANRQPADTGRRFVDPAAILQLEPALADAREAFAGGEYAAEDETADAWRFTVQLAERARDAGVAFRFETRVNRLVPVNGRVAVAELVEPDGFFRPLHADAYVLALGSFTPMLTRALGVPCPVYPVRGYSATLRLRDAASGPHLGLELAGARVVLSRLGDQVRVAGVAEVGGYARALNTARCNQLVERARALFPTTLDFDNVQFWSGLRPATPSGVPLIGRTRLRNLYLNTGHGPLGWTLGAGAGRALAGLLSGKAPDVDFPFLD